MRYRRVLLLCSVCIICAAGLVPRAHAQGNNQTFDPSMSLEQTVNWLGQQLTHVTDVLSGDGKYDRRIETRFVKAKGCTFSYSVASESQARLSAEATVSEVREVWTLDLSELDPATIRVAQTPGTEKVVWFRAAPAARNAVRTSSVRNQRYSSTTYNRAYGYFSVRDEQMLAQAAAALSHAVELCRQTKQ